MFKLAPQMKTFSQLLWSSQFLLASMQAIGHIILVELFNAKAPKSIMLFLRLVGDLILKEITGSLKTPGELLGALMVTC